VLDIVEAVVRRSAHDRAADGLLREELRKGEGVPQELARKAALALFAYFRWRGWLGGGEERFGSQIVNALALQERFQREPGSFADDELVSRAVPDWLHARMTVAPALARSLQGVPPLWLRARPGGREALVARLGNVRGCAAPGLRDALEYLGEEDLFKTPEFHAGAFEIQDLASQAVCLLCAPRAGEIWWDACAGEGGKTLGLAARMENKGLIWASDRAEWRLKRLKRRAARAGVFNYRAALWAGGPSLPTRTKFDGVLVDAPCSGVGTWHRNPHARWTTTPKDVEELAVLQAGLVGNAVRALRPGGRLVYAVCTLTRAETTELAEGVGRRFPELEPMPLQNPLDPSEPATPQLWLWPWQGGNGMFVAAWRRRALPEPGECPDSGH
jgi:16S rRNA (cytosine967-C5)-methyltransferase